MEYGFAGRGKGGTKQKVFAGYHFLRDSASEHSEFIHRANGSKKPLKESTRF
jgi:hypothetical protein